MKGPNDILDFNRMPQTSAAERERAGASAKNIARHQHKLWCINRTWTFHRALERHRRSQGDLANTNPQGHFQYVHVMV